MAISPDNEIDIEQGLLMEPRDDSPESQVWQLLCARTLVEVDPRLSGIRADDIASELLATEGYRELDADAAAYLWLARTQGVSQLIDGR